MRRRPVGDRTEGSIVTEPHAPTDNAAVAAADTAHVFHSWSAQGSLHPLALAGGHGSEVWDFEGHRYLDFSSQLINMNIGHTHPKVVAAIQEQAGILPMVAPAQANATRAAAAERILERAGESYRKVFFTNGGADANENAIRLARLVTGRDKVLSAYRSYHGNTGAAIVATGDWRRVANEYSRGHVHFWGPFPYRSEFWSTSPEEECARALHHLERTIQGEGAGSIAAIILETVPGTAGIIPPPAGYLAGVRALCDRYGILWIADEVMAGFGRTGDWFAWQNPTINAEAVRPDLVTFAKGVNSGYVPVGGVVIPDWVAAEFDERVLPGGLTYSGHPLAAASIVASIDAMAEEGIVAHAREIGETVLGPGLRALEARHPIVGEVRGLGVFWALDLVTDRETRAPIPASLAAELRAALLERGLLPIVQDNRLHVVPPCVVTEDEARRGLAIVDAALAAVAG